MKKENTFKYLGIVAGFLIYYSWLTCGTDNGVPLVLGELLIGLACYGAYKVDNLIK